MLDLGPGRLPPFVAELKPCELRSLVRDEDDVFPDASFDVTRAPDFGIPVPGPGIPDVGVLAPDFGRARDEVDDDGVLMPEGVTILLLGFD
jgi:hypothetical protein